MSSPFDDLMAAADAAVLGSYGETEGATLTPRLRSEYSAGAADPERDEMTVTGVYSAGPSEGQMRGSNTGSEMVGAARFSTTAAEFWMTAAQVAAIPYEISTGDLLTMDGQPGAPRFTVSSTQRTDLGDLNLILVREF